MPLHRGAVSPAEFVENYNQAAAFYGEDRYILQENGIFRDSDPYSFHMAMDEYSGGPLALRFTEEDGVLTEVSWSREFSTPYYGFSIDARGKEAALFSLIAMAWAEGNVFEVNSSASKELLTSIADHDEGTLERDFLGCRLIYTVTSLGEVSMVEDNFVGERFAVSFSLSRLPV